MNNKQKTGADILVQTLEQLGVDTLFGIPGVHNLKIYKSLLKSKINAVTVKNEAGAGFMADGYSRISDKVGIALTITGPGLTNIMTPMGQAYQDSVAMLVISTQLPTNIKNQNTGTLHELRNSTIMSSSVTKESRSIESIEHIESIIKDAYHLSLSGRPGPVHVEIPLDILDQFIDYELSENSFKIKSSFNPLNIDNAINLINNEQNICIICGGGAINASQEITALAEKLNAAVITTAAGKGVVSDNHPLSLGARLHYPLVNEHINNCDLIIAIGSQLAPTDLWDSKLNLNGQLIQIDLDADIFYRYPQADIGLLGDAKTIVSYILDKVNVKNLDTKSTVRNLVDSTKAITSDICGNHTSFEMGVEVLDVISEVLGEKGHLFADMCSPAYIGISEYKSTHPLSFCHPAGFGTLGYSMPAAVGAKFSQKDKRIITISGDGGFQFTLQELAVACENKQNLPIIIFNNDGYGEIKRNEQAMDFEQLIAVDSAPLNFMKLAEAYSMIGVRPTNKTEFKKACEDAFNTHYPTLIEVHVKDWKLGV